MFKSCESCNVVKVVKLSTVLFPLCLFWAFISLVKNWYLKFAVTLVIKIYSKMWELCMHNYDHMIKLSLRL